MALPRAFSDASFRQSGRSFQAPRLVTMDENTGLIEEFDDGYITHTPNGQVMMIGCGITDESFMHVDLGTMNMTRILGMTKKDRRKTKPDVLPIDDRMKSYIAESDIDPEYASRMTLKRRDEPILFMLSSNGMDMVDGHHRVLRLIQDGIDRVSYHTVSGQILEHTRIDVFIRDGDTWREAGINQALLHPPAG